MTQNKWVDDVFLDSLRQQGDDLADPTVVKLHQEHGIESVNRIFQTLGSDHQALPAEAPVPLHEFLEATSELPTGLDTERLERGAEAFRTHAFSAAVVLLASSMPSGYSAPCLSRILTISDNLGAHPYKRLMGVLQLVVQVSMPNRHAHDKVHLTARKLRLLHSGIRAITPRYRPEYREKYGVPVNHEDMLATIMGFSYLVIIGLQKLHVGLTDEQAEDFYYTWQVFALMAGIHPPGEPQNTEYIPSNIEEAGVFYDSYIRRNYRPAADNPDGVDLARHNLEMLEGLIPRPLNLLGMKRAPRVAMRELLGAEGMLRVGIKPLASHGAHNRYFDFLLRIVQSVSDEISDHFTSRLGLMIFQGMIDLNRGGEVRFIVPEDLLDIRTKL